MTESTESVERELKWTLRCDDPVAALSKVLGEPDGLSQQLNRYFLPAHPGRTMVRIREEFGALTLTVKGQGTRTDQGYYVRSECNSPIPPELLFQLQGKGTVAGLDAPACLLALTEPFRFVGLLFNTRRTYDWMGLRLELDRTEYPDGTHVWEMEVETTLPAEVSAQVAGLLKQAGVRWQPSEKGKFSSLMEKLGRVDSDRQ
jgi:hypothetical protein